MGKIIPRFIGVKHKFGSRADNLLLLHHPPTNQIGPEGETLKEIAETACIENRNHFEALVTRIYEQGGILPEDVVAFHDISGCPPASLPADPADVMTILKVFGQAEQCAVLQCARSATPD